MPTQSIEEREKAVKKREAELAAREAALNKKEEELVKAGALMPKKNWPCRWGHCASAQ
jgi:hypothetical protein